MSSGPSTLGIMTTSRLSPVSVTAAVRSSRPQGESSALTLVQNCVAPKSFLVATSTRPARAASLSAAGTPSSRLASITSTVGAMSGTLATILGFDAGKKWIMRDGRTGISRTGSGAPTARGRKKSFGLRIDRLHVGRGWVGVLLPPRLRRRHRAGEIGPGTRGGTGARPRGAVGNGRASPRGGRTGG
jgi:hypothetical protein